MRNRREILTGTAAVAAVAVGGLPPSAGAAEADPIFAAIEAHRRAEIASGEHCLSEPEIPGPSQDEWREANAVVCHAATVAAWAMPEVEPTTLAGLLAFCVYAGDNTETLCLLYRPPEANSDLLPEDGYFEEVAFAFIAEHLARLTQQEG